jgi:hypothetical protein
VDCKGILVKKNDARLSFCNNAATACLTGIHFLTYIGNQGRNTDEQDRLSGNV